MPHHFTEWLPADEIKPVNALLTRLLKAGFHIRVHDGEEFATGYTRDRALIQRETAATETTVYRLAKPALEGALTPSGKPAKWAYAGTVTLVHGNGEDVIADASARDEDGLAALEAVVWP